MKYQKVLKATKASSEKLPMKLHESSQALNFPTKQAEGEGKKIKTKTKSKLTKA